MIGSKYEEGCDCPHEDCSGSLRYPAVRGCYCHINPPCSACTDAQLVCDKCGWEDDEPEPEPVNEMKYRHEGAGIWGSYWTKPSKDLGDGKRIFDYDYDSSSGSTMVWKGKYEGPVTAQDIRNAFGKGTFGERGPTLSNGTFSYTQLTD